MDTLVAELVSFLQPLKSGSLILALVLIGLALIIFALVYQRIKTKRVQTASTAQENFENIAADLRKRALEVKKHDEGLREGELEVKECDELAELRPEHQRSQQLQRALKGSVSHTIIGLKDIQNRLLQTDVKGMGSAVPDSSKGDLQRNPDEAALKIQNRTKNSADKRVPKKGRSGSGNG